MKHAVVTGSGSGIGASIAVALAENHYCVSLMGRREEALVKTAGIIGFEDTECLVVDVTNEQSVTAGFSRAKERFGKVDVLVNNAGVAPTAPFHKLKTKIWQNVLDTNLNGVFFCTSQVIDDMRLSSGTIINIASTASLTGYAYVSAYCAAKHGVLGLTRSLALETAKLDITVNAICPGFTETDMIREGIARIVEKTDRTETEALAEFTKNNPQGRLIQPEEIAETVLWLCSPGARSITGQAISISGGETA